MEQVIDPASSDHRQRLKFHRNPFARQLCDCQLGALEKKDAGSRVAAMARSIHKRPYDAEWFALRRLTSEQSRANAKKESSTLRERVRHQIVPRKRAKQRKPAILQSRQLDAPDARRKKVCCNGLQTWLGRRICAFIEFLQSLTPPGQTDFPELRGDGARNHACESKIQIP